MVALRWAASRRPMQRFAFGRQVTAFVLGTGEPAVDWGGLDVATRTRLANVPRPSRSWSSSSATPRSASKPSCWCSSPTTAECSPSTRRSAPRTSRPSSRRSSWVWRSTCCWGWRCCVRRCTGSVPVHCRPRTAQGRATRAHRQVAATVTAWFCAVGVYVLVADDVTAGRILGVTVAFTLAALSSGSLTFLFAERASAPAGRGGAARLPRHPRDARRASPDARRLGGQFVAADRADHPQSRARSDILPRPHGRIDWATVIPRS